MFNGSRQAETHTRAKIIDAATRIIAADGFGAASVAAIAYAAQVSRTTVYSAFGSRENVVGEALAEIVRRDFAGQRPRTATDGHGLVDMLVGIIIAARHSMREHPLLKAVADTAGSNPLFDRGMKTRARTLTTEILTEAVGHHPEFTVHRDDIVELVLILATDAIILEDPDRPDHELEAHYRRWLASVISRRRRPSHP